jgi:hypothetical protein
VAEQPKIFFNGSEPTPTRKYEKPRFREGARLNELILIPGLLQTEAYARALIGEGLFAFWRKSSRSGAEGGTCVELAATWRKSSRSGESGGTCVEVAAGQASAERLVLVRDSKDPGGAVLSFAGVTWCSFARDLKGGRYDSVPVR